MDTIVPSDIPQGKHYTYTLSYPEDYPELDKAGTAFYVGKGQGRRIYTHEAHARSGKGPNRYKNNVIRKIKTSGCEVAKRILAYFDTSEEACMYEIALIFFIDGLTNLASGGEGAAGVPHSEETRRKISENTKRQMQSEEARQRLREINTGKKHSEATKQKLSIAGKGRISPNKGKTGRIPTEEQRRKQSEILKNSPRYQESIRKVHESNKGRKRLPETGQKISAAKMGHSVSEETRRKLRESRQGYQPTPETIAKVAASNKGKKRTEETRRKLSMPRPAGKGKTPWNKGQLMSEEQRQKMIGRKASPELRQKLSEAHKGQRPSNLDQLIAMGKAQKGESRKPVSEETKQKIREARSKQVVTVEHRRKMSESQKKRYALKRAANIAAITANTFHPEAYTQGLLFPQDF